VKFSGAGQIETLHSNSIPREEETLWNSSHNP